MKRGIGLIAIVVLVLLILTTAVLAVTAWGSILRSGHMGSDALVAHMAASGVFVLLVPIAAVIAPLWAVKRAETTGERRASGAGLAGILFWIWLAASWVTMATMLASMLQNLGTTGLLTMITVHRWAGAAAVIALLLLTAVGIGGRRGRRGSVAS